MKDRFKKVYQNIAAEISTLSRARRLKVGAIIVKEDRIISIGFNGTPPGWDNNCEEEEVYYEEGAYRKAQTRLKTKPEVIHAEMNALHKLASSHESGKGASMFCTHSPCLECAKGIVMSGIKDFYFKEKYRSDEGLIFLSKNKINVEQLIQLDTPDLKDGDSR